MCSALSKHHIVLPSPRHHVVVSSFIKVHEMPCIVIPRLLITVHEMPCIVIPRLLITVHEMPCIVIPSFLILLLLLILCTDFCT